MSNIGEEDDCQIVLKPDGYFRHGALEGYSRPEREACYIGEAMRREKKKEQVRRKTEELQLLQQELETSEQEISGVKKRIGILQEEFHGLPVFDELDEAIAMKKDLNWTFEKCGEECGKKQKEKEECETQKKQSAQRIITRCRELPYERNIESYEEILGAIHEYARQLESFQMAGIRFLAEEASKDMHKQLIEKEEDAIDIEDLHKKRAEQEIQEQIIYSMKEEDKDFYRHTYQEERKILDMVWEGNAKEAVRMSKEMDIEIGRLGNEELSHWRNLLTVVAALCARAAIEGGLEPRVAYRVSGFYIRKGSGCKDMAQVLSYRNDVVEDLARRVNEQKAKRHTSNYTQQCMDYIQKHFKQKIYLDQMADMIGVSSSYLSRLFKKIQECACRIMLMK